jgi:hypothetical protein
MLVFSAVLFIVLAALVEVSGTPQILCICLNRYLSNKHLEPFRNIFYQPAKIPVAPNIRTVISYTYNKSNEDLL